MVKHPGLGINVVIKHQNREALDTYLKYLIDLNVEWVRFEFNFFKPIDDGLNDYFIEKLAAADIKILGVLTGLVPGNLVNVIFPRINFPFPMKVLDQYLSFCQKMGSRYQKQIDHWEIWNEENSLRFWIGFPNPKDYVEMVRRASTLLRQINPKNTILMGAIMSNDIIKLIHFQKMGFLQQCLDLGIDQYVDAYNFHPYVSECYVGKKAKEDFFVPAITDSIEAFLHKYKSITKPIWITEFGICPKWIGIDQNAIGRIYYQIYQYAQNKKIPFFLWVLTDFKGPEYSRFNPETDFGILDWNLNTKPVYHALRDQLKSE